jgi:hypothetical protein
MSDKGQKAAEAAAAQAQLRKMLRPGDTVHTIVRHVSRSGMSRRIDLYLARKGELVYLSGWAAKALGERRHRDGGIVVGGCGMDMGFHLVYNLSSVLWPKGFRCAGKRCQSNDHHNRVEPMPKVHQSGGYALRQEWI